MTMLAGLLRKAGIGARVALGTGRAAATIRGAGDVATAPPGVRVWLPDAYGAKAYAAQIMKGAGHKYIKRVPVGTTKSGATRYRYYYEVQHGAGVHNEDHFVEGAAFRHEGGHYHVEKVDGDTLTIKHDETGETRKVSRGALAKMLSEHHSKAIDAHKAKLKADLAATMKHGSAKQQARMKEHAAKWGVVGDDGKGEPGKMALVKVSPGEIPMSVAVAAHSGTSHTPERRGEQEQQGYVEHVEAVEKRIAKMVSGADGEKRKAAADALAEYKAGYRKRLMAYLVARSGLMSTLVTGGSNFPVARMEKRGNTVDKRREELLEWSKKELGRMSREFDPRGPRVVSSDRDDAVEQLSAKVDAAEKRQAMMTEANKVVRSAKLTDEEKIERMVAQGIPKSAAAELLKPDFAGRKGFPAYETSNNAANIKRMKARIEEITAARGQETTEHAFEMPSGETGVVTDNVDENRVEIDFHTGKPTAETIAKLKARGFKWASSKGVWQRQRNNQARYAAGSIVGVDIPTPGAADATPAPADDVAEMPTPKLADEDAPTGDPGKTHPAGTHEAGHQKVARELSDAVKARGDTDAHEMIVARNKAFADVASGAKTIADLERDAQAEGPRSDEARGMRVAAKKIGDMWAATGDSQKLRADQRRKDVNEAHSAKVDPHVADKAALDGWQKNDAGAIDHVHKRAQELLPGVRMQDSHDVVSQHVYGGGVTDAYRDRMARENRIQVKPAAGASTMPEGTRVALHPVGTDYMRGEKGTVMGDSPHLAGHVVVNFDNGKSLAVRAKDVKSTGEPPRPNGANDNDAAAQAVPSADPKAKAANPGQARDIDTLRALAGVDVPRGTAQPPIKQDALESMSYRELRDLQDHVRGMAKRMTPQVAWGTPSAAQIEASARVDAFNTEHKPLNDSVSAATEAIGVAIRAAIAREASPPPNPKLGANDAAAANDAAERGLAANDSKPAGPYKTPNGRGGWVTWASKAEYEESMARREAMMAEVKVTNTASNEARESAFDAKPGHHVKSTDRMSNSGYHRSGKPNWWLRRTDQGGGNFIDIPRVRGDEKLDIKLDLEPGTYTAGAGKGKDGVRHSFTVPEKVQKSHGLAAILRTALGHV